MLTFKNLGVEYADFHYLFFVLSHLNSFTGKKKKQNSNYKAWLEGMDSTPASPSPSCHPTLGLSLLTLPHFLLADLGFPSLSPEESTWISSFPRVLALGEK